MVVPTSPRSVAVGSGWLMGRQHVPAEPAPVGLWYAVKYWTVTGGGVNTVAGLGSSKWITGSR